jgi:hypothetical protein
VKGLLDDEALKPLVRTYPPMAPLEEKDQFWLVGQLRLFKHRPHFHYGFGGTLTQDSAFRTHRFSYPDVPVDGVALILRGFVHASGEPEEFFAGWLPADHESELDRWTSFLNQQIAQRLAGVPYEGGPAAAPAIAPPPRVGAAPPAAPLPTQRRPISPNNHYSSMQAAREKGLIPVGFFRELGNGEPDAPSLVEARGRRDPAHKAEVVAYLRGGETLLTWMGAGDEDYFAPGKFFGPERICEDGVYAWPVALSNYVELYSVALPSGFETHMRHRQWHPARSPPWV